METNDKQTNLVLELLRDSKFPVLVKEIEKLLLSKSDLIQSVPFEKIYNPYKTYKKGDKIYHPAQKFRQWFEVVEGSSEDITVIFENGEKCDLVHGQSSKSPESIPPILSMSHNLAEILESTGEIATIGERIWVHASLLSQIPFARVSNFTGLEQLLQIKTNSAPQDIDKFLAICRTFSVSALYYIAPMSNIGSILNNGILAKNLAPTGHASFASREIQAKRTEILPRNDIQLCLHDYVPLFFAPRPPLIYLDSVCSCNPVYIEVNPQVLLTPGMVFSSVNARSAHRFYTDVNDLDQLDWDILHADYWNDEDSNIHKINKLKRQAEVNIPIVIPPDEIVGITVQTKEYLQEVTQIVKSGKQKIDLKATRGYFK